MSLVWINGTLIDKADAKVSPFDHGFLYGDGVWEPLRVFGGKLFRPAEHLELLFARRGTLGIDIPLSQDELLAAIEATLRANNRTEGYVRVIVTRGPGTIGPDPRKIDPQVIVIAEEYQPFPLELYEPRAARRHRPAPVRPRDDAFGSDARPAARRPGEAARAPERAASRRSWWTGRRTRRQRPRGRSSCVKDGALVVARMTCPMRPRRDAVAELARGPGACRSNTRSDHRATCVAADEVFIAGTACGVIGIVRSTVRTSAPGPKVR